MGQMRHLRLSDANQLSRSSQLSHSSHLCLLLLPFRAMSLCSVSAIFHPCGELFEAVDGVVVEGEPVLAEGAFVVCRETTMFRTVGHAEVQVAAGEAVRIVRPFLLTEGLKMRRGENFVETVLRNVSKLPFRKDVEITWIDVAIVFDDQIVAAVAAHGADGGAACGETRDDGIEKADGNSRDVFGIPCVEQLAEEVAPLAWLQGEGQGAVGVVAFDAFDILMVFKA